MASIRAVEEEVRANAVDFTSQGIQGIPDAGAPGGSACQAGEHPLTRMVCGQLHDQVMSVLTREMSANMLAVMSALMFRWISAFMFVMLSRPSINNVLCVAEHTASTRAF